ncbi:hypothetical protein [Demequina sp.]|uniref:hypothetical protein n=1 Tax=Demequina sp. TaxID=2050685 RepID=UPI003A881BAC
MGVALLVIVLSLIALIAPRALWWARAIVSLRTPELVEPSPGQLAFARVGALVGLGAGVAWGVLSMPRLNEDAALRASGVVALLTAAAIAGMLVYAVRVWRRTPEDQLPPDEPSDLAYKAQTVVFAGLAVGAAVMGAVMWAQPLGEPVNEEWVAASVDEWGAAFSHGAQQWESRPGAMAIDPVGTYVVIDPFFKEPAGLWTAAEAEGEEALAMLEAADLLLIAERDFSCEIDGAVVHEVNRADGYSNVEVALVSSEHADLGDCLGGSPARAAKQTAFVTLSEPLGARPVRGLDVAECTTPRWGATSSAAPGSDPVDHCAQPWVEDVDEYSDYVDVGRAQP